MGEFDIVLDNYDSFLGDKETRNSNDPLDPLSNDNHTKSKKRTNQGDDGNGLDDTTVPLKKQQPKLKKLDHEVLCSPAGLHRLRNETPWLDFKDDNVGENLDKLMQYYQSWAYKIYPRLNFPDFASRVLKITGKKECKADLRNWRDEYMFKNGGDGGDKYSQNYTTGGLSGLTLEDEEKNSQNSNDKSDPFDDDNSDDNDDDNERQQPQPSSPTPTSNHEGTTSHKESTNDEDEAWAAMMDADFDDDDDALFINPPPPATTTNATTTTQTYIPTSVDDFFAD
ncbi:unnamed protein product [Absidia cylindrospora]